VDDVVLAVNGRTVLCSQYGSVSAMLKPGEEQAPLVDPSFPPGKKISPYNTPLSTLTVLLMNWHERQPDSPCLYPF
jgi:hypothetical protein